jgi:hypothetical protein
MCTVRWFTSIPLAMLFCQGRLHPNILVLPHGLPHTALLIDRRIITFNPSICIKYGHGIHMWKKMLWALALLLTSTPWLASSSTFRRIHILPWPKKMLSLENWTSTPSWAPSIHLWGWWLSWSSLLVKKDDHLYTSSCLQPWFHVPTLPHQNFLYKSNYTSNRSNRHVPFIFKKCRFHVPPSRIKRNLQVQLYTPQIDLIITMCHLSSKNVDSMSHPPASKEIYKSNYIHLKLI